MDYYKAIFHIKKEEWVDAYECIQEAISIDSRNAEYKKVADSVRPKLVEIQNQHYKEVQQLYKKKKYAASLELLDTVYIIDEAESINSLRNQIVDTWTPELIKMGNSNFHTKNYLDAVYYYQKALQLDPTNVNYQTKLQNAEKALREKRKKTSILILKIVIALMLGAICFYFYNEHKARKEQLAYMAEVDSKIAQNKEIRRNIEACLSELCQELTAYKSGTRQFLSKEFNAQLEKAREIDPMFMDWDMFLDAQDNGKITHNIIDVKIINEDEIIVTLRFTDSMFGEKPAKKFNFIKEADVWKIADLTDCEGESVKEYTKRFIQANE